MSAPAAGSPLERMRAAAERRRKGAELYLEVPGWDDGTLVARIAVVGEESLKRLAGEVGTADWMADFVALTVAGLYVLEDGRPVPLTATQGGLPLRFSPEFGAAIGQPEVSTARAAVFAAFMDGGGDDAPPVLNVVALGDFADKIEAWQSNTARSIAGAIVPGS